MLFVNNLFSLWPYNVPMLQSELLKLWKTSLCWAVEKSSLLVSQNITKLVFNGRKLFSIIIDLCFYSLQMTIPTFEGFFFFLLRKFRLIVITILDHKIKQALWTSLMFPGIQSVFILEFCVAFPTLTKQLFQRLSNWVLLIGFCHNKELLRQQTY